MSPRARRELDRKLLDAYRAEIENYKNSWGIPPTRTVHLNAWAKARALVEQRTKS